MPNWAEGSLKLKGRSANIVLALKEMLLSDTVALEYFCDGDLLIFDNTAPYFYINGTRRAFIDKKQVEVWIGEEFCFIELDAFKQAWSAIHRKLKFQKVKLSKTFVMNIMIINGKFHLAI